MAKDLENTTEVGWPRRVTGGYVRDWSHDFDIDGGLGAVRTKNGVVLVETPTGRLRLTATVYSTEGRPFHSISVQRWDGSNKPKEYFALSASECTKLLEFIRRIKTTDLDTIGNFIIKDKPNDTVILAEDIDLAKLEAAAKHSPEQGEALAKLVEGTSLRDLKAVAYRRIQLDHFKKLLDDAEFREEERQRCGGPEALWQDFFERNPWIFGYGLTYIPLAKLDGQTLETYIIGRGIATPGKEADALMKSNALISGMNVVEIKHYDSELLANDSKRSGVYHPSPALSEAVAQVQVTIQLAVEEFQHSLRLTTKTGAKTGEELHFVQPRGFLVIGNLDQLCDDGQVNDHRYRSFEVYRRSLRSPEIFTFDELFERARHIVADNELDHDE